MNTHASNTLSIGTLADRYGVCAETLRVWERRGLIPAALRTRGGHRRYGDEHVEALDALLGGPVCAEPV